MTILVRKLAELIGDWAPEETVGGLNNRHAAEVHSRRIDGTERARMNNKCPAGAKLDLKKCFDSVAPMQAIRKRKRVGAPW